MPKASKNPRETMTYEINTIGVLLTGVPPERDNWEAALGFEAASALAELVDNGLAVPDTEGGISVPWETACALDDDLLRALGLPSHHPFAVRLRGDGVLLRQGFKYIMEYRTRLQCGELIPARRQGGMLVTGGGAEYLLNADQFRLASLLEDANSLHAQAEGKRESLLRHAEICKMAERAGAALDSVLSAVKVQAPERISLKVDETNGLCVMPHITDAQDDAFASSYRRLRSIPGIIPLTDKEGNGILVPLTDGQQTGLQALKERGAGLLEDLLKRPTQYFDPDEFELATLYSDRVIELGLYRPIVKPFVSPYKSEWMAGATVTAPVGGTARIVIGTMEEADELDVCIRRARAEGRTVCTYRDVTMPIEDAERLSRLARRQIRSPHVNTLEANEAERRVLIIKENAESEEYKADADALDLADRYTLEENPGLRDGFKLKRHQEWGVAWLQELYRTGGPGALLADDMGLGKTLQVLYFMDWHARRNPGHGPYLIVAPVSLLENWEREYRRFFKDGLGVLMLAASDVPRQFDAAAVQRMQSAGIILTNYETLRLAQLNICAVQFDVVVLDEAQHIKTPGRMVTNAAKALQTKMRIALTGTPVENTLLDVWCIMDFCVPGLLGSARQFLAKYQPKRVTDTSQWERLGRELRAELGDYFLRRLLRDAIDELPPLTVTRRPCTMKSLQLGTYQYITDEYKRSAGTISILTAIQSLRSVSEHPYLYDGSLPGRTSAEIVPSGARFQALLPVLDAIETAREKVIIFAERRDTQRALQRLVRDHYGFTATIINGATAVSGDASRQRAIDRFQAPEGFGVIIMSPLAAGTGLNITGANHVIHFSRCWNPAKEAQATGRAYRIGQTRPVHVYYPLAVADGFQSFDITLNKLLESKQRLATATLFPSERVEVKSADFMPMLQ